MINSHLYRQFFLIIIGFNFFILQGQTTVVKLEPEDGNYASPGPIYLTIMEQTTDSIPRLNFWGGAAIFPTSGITFGGASYFVPEKILIAMDLGWGGNLETNVFLKNWKKPCSISQSIATDNQYIYRTSIPSTKLKSLGLNLGGGFSTVGSSYFSKFSNHTFLSYGVSLVSSKHAFWKMNTNYGQQKGSSMFRINISGISYFNHKYFPRFGEIIVPNDDPKAGTSSGNDIYISEEDFNNRSTSSTIKNGIQFFIDGYVSTWSKYGIFGFRYKFGIGTQPSKSISNYVIAGLGLNFTFL